MTAQVAVSSGLAIVGVISAAVAIVHERAMHKHRQPGISYADATLRRDGGYKRTDLFTADGLAHQARAARYGVMAAVAWVLALIAFVVLR